MGMLINVVCAIDLLSFPDTWAADLCRLPEKVNAIKAASQALADHHRGDQSTNEEVPA